MGGKEIRSDETSDTPSTAAAGNAASDHVHGANKKKEEAEDDEQAQQQVLGVDGRSGLVQELRATDALLHRPPGMVPHVTLHEFDAWLRSLPSGTSVAVRSVPRARILVSFETKVLQKTVDVHAFDDGAPFNSVDLVACSVGCSISSLLAALQPVLRTRPDACVTVNGNLLSLPQTIVLGCGSSPFYWTAMNPWRWVCDRNGVEYMVAAINRSGDVVTPGEFRAAVLAKLGLDAVAAQPYLTSVGAAALAEERLGQIVESFYRVGPRWFTANGLVRALPRMQAQADWPSLFSATGRPDRFSLYVCKIDQERMEENFGPVSSLVERLLQEQNTADAAADAADN